MDVRLDFLNNFCSEIFNKYDINVNALKGTDHDAFDGKQSFIQIVMNNILNHYLHEHSYVKDIFYGTIHSDGVPNDLCLLTDIKNNNKTFNRGGAEVIDGIEIQLFYPEYFTQIECVYHNYELNKISWWRENAQVIKQNFDKNVDNNKMIPLSKIEIPYYCLFNMLKFNTIMLSTFDTIYHFRFPKDIFKNNNFFVENFGENFIFYKLINEFAVNFTRLSIINMDYWILLDLDTWNYHLTKNTQQLKKAFPSNKKSNIFIYIYNYIINYFENLQNTHPRIIFFYHFICFIIHFYNNEYDKKITLFLCEPIIVYCKYLYKYKNEK